MTMTTADARLTGNYALRDAALERIRRLRRAGCTVVLQYRGENRPIYLAHSLDGEGAPKWPGSVIIELSRFTNRALMEREYAWLIESLTWWFDLFCARGGKEVVDSLTDSLV